MARFVYTLEAPRRALDTQTRYLVFDQAILVFMTRKHNRVAILTNEQESPPMRNPFHHFTSSVRRLPMVYFRIQAVIATMGGEQV